MKATIAGITLHTFYLAVVSSGSFNLTYYIYKHINSDLVQTKILSVKIFPLCRSQLYHSLVTKCCPELSILCKTSLKKHFIISASNAFNEYCQTVIDSPAVLKIYYTVQFNFMKFHTKNKIIP